MQVNRAMHPLDGKIRHMQVLHRITRGLILFFVMKRHDEVHLHIVRKKMIIGILRFDLSLVPRSFYQRNGIAANRIKITGIETSRYAGDKIICLAQIN